MTACPQRTSGHPVWIQASAQPFENAFVKEELGAKLRIRVGGNLYALMDFIVYY
jgi:hypothetical protein